MGNIADLRLRSCTPDGDFHLDGEGIDYLFKRIGEKQVRVIRQEAYTNDVPQKMPLHEAKVMYEELLGGGPDGFYPHRVFTGDEEKFFTE